MEQAVAEGGLLADTGLGVGHGLLAFVTPECPYCQMTRRKIGSILERHGLDTSRVAYVEPGGTAGCCLPVGERTYRVDTDLFMQATHGNRPYVLLLEEGKARLAFHYRNLSERRIVRSLQGQ